MSNERTRQRLEAKVQAVNAAHAYLPKLRQDLRKALEPFVGKKVLKQGGSLTAQVEKALKGVLSNGNGASYSEPQVYRFRSEYSLTFTVKTCKPTGDCGCLYYERSVDIGNLKDRVLTELDGREWITPRTDYTADEIEGKRKAAEEAREKAREAESACWPFGERDN
jgi:hypothetical protein